MESILEELSGWGRAQTEIDNATHTMCTFWGAMELQWRTVISHHWGRGGWIPPFPVTMLSLRYVDETLKEKFGLNITNSAIISVIHCLPLHVCDYRYIASFPLRLPHLALHSSALTIMWCPWSCRLMALVKGPQTDDCLVKARAWTSDHLITGTET